MFIKVRGVIMNINLISSVHDIGDGITVKMNSGDKHTFKGISLVDFHEKMKKCCLEASKKVW